MYSVYEIKEKLKVACDEITILEVLDISIEELLDRFEDKIELHLELLSRDFEGDFMAENGDWGEDEHNSPLPEYFEGDDYQIIKGEYYGEEE
jgi:hypothetical protein